MSTAPHAESEAGTIGCDPTCLATLPTVKLIRDMSNSELIYAIGDVHGDLAKLQSIMERITDDWKRAGRPDYKVVFIGDLVDRRSNSKGVIQYLIDGLADGQPWVILRGNHDRMFSLFLDHPANADPILRPDLTWLHPRLGGNTTLASYGINVSEDSDPAALHADALQKIPATHVQFLKSLRNFFETDDYFFAHAGVEPNTPLNEQSEDDLLWIRAPFHEHTGMYRKIIVHGHTPVPAVVHYGNRINIDTGAAYGHELSAIVIDDGHAEKLAENGRVEIPRETYLG